MQFNKDKAELVYHTSSFKDEHIIVCAEICKIKKIRMVLIVPTCKRYSFHILRAFELLGDDLLVYEITMGMGVVLEARAKKYVEYNENSKLYEKNPFFKY